jgi:hypothetical protein
MCPWLAPQFDPCTSDGVASTRGAPHEQSHTPLPDLDRAAVTAVVERPSDADSAPDRTSALADRLKAAVGAERVLTERAQLRTYECDGLANFR